MSIVYASKSGDAFGKYAFQGLTKKEKQKFARKKQIEEEVQCDIFNTSNKSNRLKRSYFIIQTTQAITNNVMPVHASP